MACSVSRMPASSRSTNATRAPSRANNSALARPMPEPAPVTMAIRSFRRMSHSLSMTGPPVVQVVGRIRAAVACPPAEFVCHPRNRERRTVGIAVQNDVWLLARAGETTDETRIAGSKPLTPFQSRPLLARRYMIKAVPRPCRLDQHGHGVGYIGRIDPVANARPRQHGLSSFL